MPVNDEIVEEFRKAREALGEVATAVSHLTPRGELDRAAAAVLEDNRRWRRSVVLLIVGGPMLFILTLGIGIKGDRDRAHQVKILSNGVKCLLADLDDHRHVNQEAHEALARNHGFGKIIGPDVIPLTKEQAARLKLACNAYVQGAVGGAQPGVRADASNIMEGSGPHG